MPSAKKRLRLTASAQKEFDAQIEYIMLQSYSSAELVLMRVWETFKAIKLQPEGGTPAERNYRLWHMKKTRMTVVYRVKSREIVVSRIRHESRKKA